MYRTGESLKAGVEKINAVVDSFKDVKVTDRSLIWNSDLIETLELQNLLAQVFPPSRTARLVPVRASVCVCCMAARKDAFPLAGN